MRRGDVFTLSLRGNARKPRPGVIVHADDLIFSGQPVLVCPLTSIVLTDAVTRPTIQPSSANGLRMVSQVMVNRMTSADTGEIGRIIGALSNDDMARIDLALMISLGLASQTTGQQ